MAQSLINQGDLSVETDPNKILPDEKMLKLVLERWRAAKDWRAGKSTQWERWYQLYRSYAEQKDWPHSVSLFIPLIWSTVESFLPRMVVQRPSILVEARGDEKLEASVYHRELIEYQWEHLRVPMTIAAWVKEALIYGTGIAKIGWDKRTGPRSFRVVAEDGSVTEDTDEEFVIKDDPFIALVPLENFYPEPGAPDVEEARFVIERRKMTAYEIEDEGKALGWNEEAIKKLKDRQLAANQPKEEDRMRLAREATFGTPDSMMSKNRAHIYEFEVLEYWEDGRYAVVVEDPEVILVNERNPYWHGRKPYLRIVDNILPGEFYGVGEPEILESINLELNQLHNLRLEAVQRATFQMFKVRLGSPVTPAMMEYKQQGIVWVTSQDDVEPLYPGNPQSAPYREEEGLRLWAQQTTGANDAFQGLETDLVGETATGASILAQAAASRVGLKFLSLSEMGLRPLGDMLISLNEQNFSQERAIGITGMEGMTHQRIGPAQLATNGGILDVKIDIGATDPINRQVSMQQNQNLLMIFMQLYGDPNHPVIQTLIKRIAELGDIPIDPQTLMIQPNPANVAASGGAPASTEGAPGPAQGTVASALEGA
jgi:hypothetical protein